MSPPLLSYLEYSVDPLLWRRRGKSLLFPSSFSSITWPPTCAITPFCVQSVTKEDTMVNYAAKPKGAGTPQVERTKATVNVPTWPEETLAPTHKSSPQREPIRSSRDVPETEKPGPI